MNISFCTEEDRKKAKRHAWASTILYGLLLPFLFMFAAASAMIFDDPSMPVFLGLSIIFLCFCIPLSIPFTLFFVWYRYLQEEYKKCRQFCLIPCYLALGALSYHILTDTIRALF